MSKLLKNIVKARILNFLEPLNFFIRDSTVLKKIKILNWLCRNFFLKIQSLNSGTSNKTTSLFLDISKAFDTVHHETLLDKHFSAGIRRTPLDWLESYLTGRTQTVNIPLTENVSWVKHRLSGTEYPRVSVGPWS